MSAQPPAQVPARAHDRVIPQREYDRKEQRRGRRHAYTRLDLARTAPVVVDMASFVDGPYARGITPPAEALAGSLRRAGGLVARVLPGDGRPSAVRREFYGPEVADRFRTSGGSGLTGRLWPQFTVDEDRDLLTGKEVASVVFPGLSPLPGLPAGQSIDTVLVCGAVTDVCVAGTTRDAFTLSLRVIIAIDGTPASNDGVYHATLRTRYRSFGDVRPTPETLDLIRDGR